MRLAIIVGAVVTIAACGGSASVISPEAEGGVDGGADGASSPPLTADPATGNCQYACDTKADCCTDCTYPLNSDCVNHRCVWQGCAGDADCQRPTTGGLPSGPGVVCRPISGVRRCVRPCAKDVECVTPESNSDACFATDDGGQLYCSVRINGPNPCGNEPQCWACKSDGDCDGKHGVGFGVCSPVTHTCRCAVDTQCPAHDVCDHSIP
jgi:hypothetical protein